VHPPSFFDCWRRPKTDPRLRDRYFEKDLEDAILRELENFLLELALSETCPAYARYCRSLSKLSSWACVAGMPCPIQ
jgi:hypothetical protein